MRELASRTDQDLYHAFRAAEICAEVMLASYGQDYGVEYDETEYDPAFYPDLKEAPAAIKLAVDRRCEDAARAYLRGLYPDFGFVGEESFDPGEMQKPFFWCVDPLCGSLGYYKKSGCFGTSVALVARSRGPLVGALICPALNLAGIASRPEGRAFYAGEFKHFQTEGLKVLVSTNLKANPHLPEILARLKPARVDYQESVPAKSLQVLAGTYDLSFALPRALGGSGPKIWDLAASQVFFQVEGKVMVDFEGRAFDLTGRAGFRFEQGFVLARDRETADLCLRAFEKA